MTTQVELMRGTILRVRDRLQKQLTRLHGWHEDHFANRLHAEALAKLIDELDAALDGECPEDPRQVVGRGFQRYMCPRCGCAVRAGMPHGKHTSGCWLGLEEILI
jgi:hypothetical protein